MNGACLRSSAFQVFFIPPAKGHPNYFEMVSCFWLFESLELRQSGKLTFGSSKRVQEGRNGSAFRHHSNLGICRLHSSSAIDYRGRGPDINPPFSLSCSFSGSLPVDPIRKTSHKQRPQREPAHKAALMH